MAIDPTDADRVFLRVIGAAGDTLAIATDGGATVTVPLTFDGGLGAFVRTSAGTLLAFGTDGGSPALYRSRDGGATFAAVAGPPPILALAERAGTVYAATDTTLGSFAEATSTDEGTTWTPGMAFAQVAAIDPCLKSACQTDCLMRAQQQQWPAAICAADAPIAEISAPRRRPARRGCPARRGLRRPAERRGDDELCRRRRRRARGRPKRVQLRRGARGGRLGVGPRCSPLAPPAAR